MKVWPGLVQRTEQWFRARAGRPTASRMDRVITPAGRDSRAWEEYAIELVAQTVRPEDGAWEGNAWTQRRYGLEPQARADFMEVTRLSVEPVGFVTRGDGVAGCSPDGLVRRRDAEGWPRGRFFAGLELTCPLPKNHARHLVEGVLPARFRPQVHGAMAITGLREWYFMSYCPGLAPFILRVRRDDYTERVADALERFFIYYADRRKRLLPRLLGKEEEG